MGLSCSRPTSSSEKEKEEEEKEEEEKEEEEEEQDEGEEEMVYYLAGQYDPVVGSIVFSPHLFK